MPLDVVGLRKKAQTKLADKGLLLQFEQPAYTDHKRTGTTTVFAHGLIDLVTPSHDRGVENQDVVFTVAALQSTAAGVLTDTLFDLKIGDHIVRNGDRIQVIQPSKVEPNGQAILYDRALAGVRKSAT